MTRSPGLRPSEVSETSSGRCFGTAVVPLLSYLSTIDWLSVIVVLSGMPLSQKLPLVGGLTVALTLVASAMELAEIVRVGWLRICETSGIDPGPPSVVESVTRTALTVSGLAPGVNVRSDVDQTPVSTLAGATVTARPSTRSSLQASCAWAKAVAVFVELATMPATAYRAAASAAPWSSLRADNCRPTSTARTAIPISTGVAHTR